VLFGSRYTFVDAPLEVRPIGETRQLIVIRGEGQPLFGTLAVFDLRFELAITALEALQLPGSIPFAHPAHLKPIDCCSRQMPQRGDLFGREGPRVLIDHGERSDSLAGRRDKRGGGECTGTCIPAMRPRMRFKAGVALYVRHDEAAVGRFASVPAWVAAVTLLLEGVTVRRRDAAVCIVREADVRGGSRTQQGCDVAQAIEARITTDVRFACRKGSIPRGFALRYQSEHLCAINT